MEEKQTRNDLETRGLHVPERSLAGRWPLVGGPPPPWVRSARGVQTMIRVHNVQFCALVPTGSSLTHCCIVVGEGGNVLLVRLYIVQQGGLELILDL